MTLYILYSTDPWLSEDSKKIEGVFSTERLLNAGMGKLLELGEMTAEQIEQVKSIRHSQLSGSDKEYVVVEVEGNQLLNY